MFHVFNFSRNRGARLLIAVTFVFISIFFLEGETSREKVLKAKGFREIEMSGSETTINLTKSQFVSFFNVQIPKDEGNCREHPTDPAYFTELGEHCLAAKRIPEGLNSLKEAVRIAPHDLSNLIDVADILSKFVRVGERERIYSIMREVEGLISDPSFHCTEKAEDYFTMGEIYGRLRDYSKAVLVFKKALELQPDDIVLLGDKEFCVDKKVRERYLKAFNDAKEKLRLNS